MTREEILDKHGSREDGKHRLYDLNKLEKLIQSTEKNSNNDWHCSGREKKEDNVGYCIFAFPYNQDKDTKCTEDCKFYKALHDIPKNL